MRRSCLPPTAESPQFTQNRAFESLQKKTSHVLPILPTVTGALNHYSLHLKFVRSLYNLLFLPVLLFLLPGFLARMLRRGNYRHKFGQRFGLYSKRVKTQLLALRGQCFLIHAVSVGEVLIALKFIDSFRKTHPIPIVLSTTTSTAYALAVKNKPDWLEVIYHPIDFFRVARKVIRTIHPRALILVEAEVWPNLTYEAKRHNIPTILINARLSARSERRYYAARFFSKPIFQLLDVVLLPDESDRPRWKRIGVKESALQLTGSIKFDDSDTPRADPSACLALLQQLGISPGSEILLGGSTHDGEELLLTKIYLHLRLQFPNLFLVLVPRHCERGDTLSTELTHLKLHVARRSAPNPLASVDPKPDLLLIDTIGELRQWYSIATVVFIGKSLTAHGGQNPAEPVTAGKPVVFGPNMENFEKFVHLLKASHGALQIKNTAELESTIQRLLAHPDERAILVHNANTALIPHRGATHRTVEIIANILKEGR